MHSYDVFAKLKIHEIVFIYFVHAVFSHSRKPFYVLLETQTWSGKWRIELYTYISSYNVANMLCTPPQKKYDSLV